MIIVVWDFPKLFALCLVRSPFNNFHFRTQEPGATEIENQNPKTEEVKSLEDKQIQNEKVENADDKNMKVEDTEGISRENTENIPNSGKFYNLTTKI